MNNIQIFKQAFKNQPLNKITTLTGSSSFAYTTLNKTLRNQSNLLKKHGYAFVQYTSPDFQRSDVGIQYSKGFRNTHWVELKEGVIPKHTNPKYPPFNLVTEQVTGPGGFTGEATTGGPLRTWLYKKERSIKIGPYVQSDLQPFLNQEYVNPGPNPIRIKAPAVPNQPTDFLEGQIPFANNDHILHYQYSFNKSMSEDFKVYHNIDGEMLIQPSVGALEIVTECGILELAPGTIGVITKNIKFQVNLKQGTELAQGVITELKNDRSFSLPQKGPIGANGLANTEYFETPVPYVDSVNLNKTHRVFTKKQGQFYEAEQQNSPFDVYGWKGNYAPYRFNLDDFVPVVAGRKDHLDPSSHLVLAVPDSNGVNHVEIVAFVPRWNCNDKSQPTYLPPYDHRNNGKSEIMHYLGGYDARLGTSAGFQTVHDMGVTHGNDQATFEKARSGAADTVFLDHKPATMVELTNFLQVAPHVLEQQDSEYGKGLRGEGSTPTSQIRRKESLVGAMKKITFTAFESSIIPIFEVLMPNPEVFFNEKTGLQTRKYRNSRGDIFEINAQQDQNAFWTIYKKEEGQNVNFDQLKLRDAKNATNEELTLAANTIKSFFNRGTVISSVDLEVEDPVSARQYFLANGFVPGIDKDCITFTDNAPLNFRLIKKGDFVELPNEKSSVSTIDHTVINVFRKQLPQMFTLFPDEFWGGDPRDLRAHGVQFDTRVLTSTVGDVQQLVPVNNLDATEEDILHRIQDNDTYLPPYIQQAAMGNQITRGMYDTNRTLPQMSKDAFLQHIAMGVNTEFGDISYHLENFRKQGMTQIPPPPGAYYELSEVDLSQRLLLPILLGLAGVDGFKLPYTFYNGLLKPKDADVNRLNELLVVDNQWEQSKADVVVNAYKQIQPVLALVGDSVLEFNESEFKSQLESTFQAQNISYTSEQVETIIKLISFNKKKIERAAEVGSLIDFQIINVGGKNQTGYLDQTFSVPITQKNEGTSGIFLEFLVRTSYEEIFELIEQGKFYNEKVEWKCCGAFGQGNFGNLMLGQQLGIKKVDEELKKRQQQQGFAFKLPMLDYNTITSSPLDHLYEHIGQAKERGDVQEAQQMESIVDNIKDIIEECKNRNLWN